MAESLSLIGFRYSVYTRIVRMALQEMNLSANHVEVDPFASPPDPALSVLTPFGRVPVLRHGKFTLTETAAILRYLDRIGGAASLVPSAPQAAARMEEVIGIVDAYGYVPLVRQVFSHAVYRPHFAEPADPNEVRRGMRAAVPVLAALDAIAAEGLQLAGDDVSLADLHLAPIIDYFTRAPAAADMLRRHAALSRWWSVIADRPSLRATDPFAAGPPLPACARGDRQR